MATTDYTEKVEAFEILVRKTIADSSAGLRSSRVLEAARAFMRAQQKKGALTGVSPETLAQMSHTLAADIAYGEYQLPSRIALLSGPNAKLQPQYEQALARLTQWLQETALPMLLKELQRKK